MSTGGIIGGVIGGAAGFFLGGPLGAIYGAGMGFSAGMILDPITPDEPNLASPNPNEIIMEPQEGGIVAEVLGTASLTGNLLMYGQERVENITETVETGKGGGSDQTVVTGYEYYMTWAVGICAGPINTLHCIYKGTDIVWEGSLDISYSINGRTTVILDGMGTCVFYFGTEDQPIENTLLNLVYEEQESLISGMRYLCYAIMLDCKLVVLIGLLL